MGDSGLRYDVMVEAALRGVMRDALGHVVRHGLPGAHHFYLSFRTGHPGVQIDPSLKARFPEEMTIVLQHQFWDLKVEQDGFSVTLSFSNAPQRLAVPFAAVTAFNDPSVNFGLQFQSLAERTANKPVGEARGAGGSAGAAAANPPGAPHGIAHGTAHGTAKPLPEARTAAKSGQVTPLPKPAPSAGPAPAAEKVVALDSFRKK
ncbi:MAG: SspB family protein [Rhodospirillales bacterium]